MERSGLSVSHITKRYPGVVALDDVSLSFRPGEVHAIMGENGAGKSTLIKIISGAERPDSGVITFGDKSYDRMSTRQSMELGVAIIYQELMMVPALSSAENVFLGTYPKNGPLIDKRGMEKRAAEIFNSLDIDIDVRKPVRELSVAFRQMVEIARALSRNASILIMDEPSATLTEEEVQTMLKLILKLRESGVCVIYISHRIDEVLTIADRISVLRDGRYVTTLDADKTNRKELVQAMVGRTLKETFPDHKTQIGDVGLEVCGFTGNGVRDISLKVRHGEILGLGGLIGAGRTELSQLIFGAARLEGGKLLLDGVEKQIRTPAEALGNGIGLIPEDRKQLGLLLEQNVKQNITLPLLPRISRGMFVNRKKEADISNQMVAALDIRTPSLDQKVKNLSGGNQQKVVLAKWLGANCDYLIFDEPTRGIDVGAKQEIYKLLETLAGQGKCILMISSEMEELLGMSNRIVILCEGKLAGQLEKSEFSQEAVLTLASGMKLEEGNTI